MSGRWDKTNTRGGLYFRMLLIGAFIAFAAGCLQLLVFVSANEFPLAESNAIGEFTLGIMLVWAAFFMRRLRDYRASER
jgi:hypothetical protein